MYMAVHRKELAAARPLEGQSKPDLILSKPDLILSKPDLILSRHRPHPEPVEGWATRTLPAHRKVGQSIGRWMAGSSPAMTRGEGSGGDDPGR